MNSINKYGLEYLNVDPRNRFGKIRKIGEKIEKMICEISKIKSNQCVQSSITVGWILKSIVNPTIFRTTLEIAGNLTRLVPRF